jgi:hypothetical protein
MHQSNVQCKRTRSIAIELNKVKLHMRMLGAKNTCALLIKSLYRSVPRCLTHICRFTVRVEKFIIKHINSCLLLCIILRNLHRRNLFALCLISILTNLLLSLFLFISIDFWLINRERNIRKNIKVCNRKCTF